MFAIINRILDWFKSLFWKEEMELTLVGLQFSGKTTFVNVIAVSILHTKFYFFLTSNFLCVTWFGFLVWLIHFFVQHSLPWLSWIESHWAQITSLLEIQSPPSNNFSHIHAVWLIRFQIFNMPPCKSYFLFFTTSIINLDMRLFIHWFISISIDFSVNLNFFRIFFQYFDWLGWKEKLSLKGLVMSCGVAGSFKSALIWISIQI